MAKRFVSSPAWTRRSLLARALAVTATKLAWPWSSRGDESRTKPGLIVRSERPLDLETPVEALGGEFTPNDLFFVRSHFGPPAVGLGVWSLQVDGLVDRPRRLGLDDLKKLPRQSVVAVCQCAGNGRALYRPRVAGVGWEKGAVGQAVWSGPRLADVLATAGVKVDAKHVHVMGSDAPPNPKTPAFYRSIPLERALHPDTIVALTMNGAPLPWLHGGPARLVVPGWTANHWIKWLRAIKLDAREADGFFMQTAYRMPRDPSLPAAQLTPADLVPVSDLNVKSLITHPGSGASLKSGRIEVRGVAWTGPGVVERVEVRFGDEPWRAARMIDPAVPHAWRRWSIEIDLDRAGEVEIASRATDSHGLAQPETTPWNKSGYLWNAIDRVRVNIHA